MAEFPDPETRNELAGDCRRCPALAASRNHIAWGQGDPESALVVVGEAPGAGDPDAEVWAGGNHTGMAYTTRHSGRRVRDLASELGFPEAYFTNAVKCHPPGNRDPEPDERANCAGYLEDELEQVEPDAVLATGKHATVSLLGLAGRSIEGFVATVGECVRNGEALEWPGFEPALVPALHPSYENVWLGRLGLSRAAYVSGLRRALDAGE
jgi:DNA polymerase